MPPPPEAQRQRAQRPQVCDALAAALAALRAVSGGGHRQRVCQLRASRRSGRYLQLTSGGQLGLEAATLRAQERLDGKCVIPTNADSLSPEDLALGSKQWQRVEEGGRTLNSGLRLRPLCHRAPHRIHAHVALAVLALLLERVAEQACGDTGRNVRDDLRQVKLARFVSPHGEVWQVTEPTPTTANRLRALGIKPPPPMLRFT